MGVGRCAVSGQGGEAKTRQTAEAARWRTTSLLFLRVVDEP